MRGNFVSENIPNVNMERKAPRTGLGKLIEYYNENLTPVMSWKYDQET